MAFRPGSAALLTRAAVRATGTAAHIHSTAPVDRRTTPVLRLPGPRRRCLGGFAPGLGQQRLQGLGGQALEGAKIGRRQGGALKVTQQRQPGLARLLQLSLLGLLLRLHLRLRLLIAVAGYLAAPGQLFTRQLAVLFAQITRRLAVQIKALAGLAQGDQVAGAAGVAPEKS